LGNVRSALLAWLSIRAAGGQFLLRVEDLDPDRSRPQWVEAMYRDLEFLGLTWDGPVVVQSKRRAAYDHALEYLGHRGRIYRCICSRADIARAVAAPHLGEEGPVYPGTCRGRNIPPTQRAALRFRVESGVERFHDGLHGDVEQEVEREVGDFVVQRADGVASYQLAVVVDDAESGVTEVVRGDDLLTSTPRQLQLIRALNLLAPTYRHVPLLVQPDGRRLAKREGALTVDALRQRGVSGTAVVGLLAKWSGLHDGSPVSAAELVHAFDWRRVLRSPVVVAETDLRQLTP
jgi:glutamyl-tRNA synthetase